MVFTDMRPSRTLVLCLDGTWNEFDDDNTNVVRLFGALQKENVDEQLCYYQAGVGTGFKPGVVNPLLGIVAKVLDAAFAWYLDQHVIDAYRFLMQNYRHGDKICLFGFSRGAYTVRALAGMLHKVGLLPRDNEEQLPFAYKLYARRDRNGRNLAAGFKRTFCRAVHVEFVGVWDTVSSVGLIMSKTLPFTNSNRSIKTFRHALALDERRARFQANYFHRLRPQHKPEEGGSKSHSCLVSLSPPKWFKWRTSDPDYTYVPDSDEEWSETAIKEVWFAGGHGDVGGGDTLNSAKASASNIPLRWMIREVIASQCGVVFAEGALRDLGVGTKLQCQSEEESPHDKELSPCDAQDLKEPLHNSLKTHPIWWILEIVPMTFLWQDVYGQWRKRWGCNFGQGRDIIEVNPKFHTTVRERMKKLAYEPIAHWEGEVKFVE